MFCFTKISGTSVLHSCVPTPIETRSTIEVTYVAEVHVGNLTSLCILLLNLMTFPKLDEPHVLGYAGMRSAKPGSSWKPPRLMTKEFLGQRAKQAFDIVLEHRSLLKCNPINEKRKLRPIPSFLQKPQFKGTVPGLEDSLPILH